MDIRKYQQQIITTLLDKGFLVGPDVITIPNINKEKILSLIQHYNLLQDAFLVFNKDMYLFLSQLHENQQPFDHSHIDWLAFDSNRVMFERKHNTKPYDILLKRLSGKISLHPQQLIVHKKNILPKPSETIPSSIEIINNYDFPGKKRTIKDFVSHYKHRYTFGVNILKNRVELENLISINRLQHKRDSGVVSIIGLIFDKMTSKNGNIILTLEDSTGRIKVFLHKDGPLKEIIPYLTCDEIVGVCGTMKHNMLFATNLLFPDIPINHLSPKFSDDICATFISDLQIGSTNFLEKEFLRFINWLNGNIGNDSQKVLAKKIKYLFIVGDAVDGVGVYPNQEHEAAIPDIFDQYKKTKELLSLIRKDIHIIMCPGNHDAMRIAEPQPALNDFNKVLSELDNITLVSNPGTVKIHSSQYSEGISFLLYHGYSYDYYVGNIEPIRSAGGYNRADLIMKFLLQKRHLAPTHTSTLYVPLEDEDPLLIKDVPDVFVSGHIHKSCVSNYNGVLLIGCSCWEKTSPLQEKLGHTPDPGKVPILHLKTKEITLMNFCEELS